jgi:hypothetical protein
MKFFALMLPLVLALSACGLEQIGLAVCQISII